MQNDKEKIKTELKKRLYKFALKLVEFLDALPNDNASSIIANYIEGQAASSKKDFTNYFNTSLKSANESKLWLALLRDSKRARSKDVSWLVNGLDEIANIFSSSILTLKGRK